MEHKLKNAFDGIAAEEELKRRTLSAVRDAAVRQAAPKKPRGPKRMRLGLASVALVLCMGVFGYFYLTPIGYISVEVNPSVELTVNRFDRVIGARAYNGEGEAVLSALRLRNLRYGDAVAAVVDGITGAGYLTGQGLVSVAVQNNRDDRVASMLPALEDNIRQIVSGHHITAEIEVFPVDTETLAHAHQQEVSPAKYLAILELQEVYPAATVEGCRDHSITEIRQMTQSHHGRQSSPSDGYGNGQQDAVPGGEEATSGNGHGSGHGHRGKHE